MPLFKKLGLCVPSSVNCTHGYNFNTEHIAVLCIYGKLNKQSHIYEGPLFPTQITTCAGAPGVPLNQRR